MSGIYLIIVSAIILRVSAQNNPGCVINDFASVNATVARCTNIIVNSFTIPGGQQVVFNLTDSSTLIFRGKLTFLFQQWIGPMLVINGNNITVIGEKGCLFDGHGELYWDSLGTWGNVTKPKFVKIHKTNNSVFVGINIKNCPVGCVSIQSAINVTIKNWFIDNREGDDGVAPVNKSGHNTDGFGIGTSENILIEDSTVFNQDDCVVINSGRNITVRRLACNGSHGYSVSVKNGTVEDVIFENSTISNAENGIHVKTRVDAGLGLIKNVLYRNIILKDCTFFGVSVQQNYQNLPPGIPQNGPPSDRIPIRNLTLTNVTGNVRNGGTPVFILCAGGACSDWKWTGVVITGGKNNCTNFTPQGFNCAN